MASASFLETSAQESSREPEPEQQQPRGTPNRSNYYFKVSSGLFDPKHRKKIGIALWVFQWFIHHEHQPDGKPDGLVNLGRPVTCHQIAADLGVSAVSVKRDIATLEQEGYIRSVRVAYGGKVYHVAKPFRWKKPHEQWITSDPLVNPAEQGDRSEVIPPMDQKRSHQWITSDPCNKEKRTKNTTNLKPSLFELGSNEESKPSPPSRKEAKPKRKSPSAEGMVLANELLAEILKNKPDFHITDDRLAKWGRSADLMISNDHRSPPRISALIRWVQHDDFWKCNVLSMDKLREKFDQLEMKMQQPKGGNGNGRQQISSKEYLEREFEAARRLGYLH